jgi:hypothetical protein
VIVATVYDCQHASLQFRGTDVQLTEQLCLQEDAAAVGAEVPPARTFFSRWRTVSSSSSRPSAAAAATAAAVAQDSAALCACLQSIAQQLPQLLAAVESSAMLRCASTSEFDRARKAMLSARGAAGGLRATPTPRRR